MVSNPPHAGTNCPSPTRIPQNKGSWRSYIGKILFPAGQQTVMWNKQMLANNIQVVQIDTGESGLIEYDPYLYPIKDLTFYDEMNQGNGQESC
jgi:hypothetical protein